MGWNREKEQKHCRWCGVPYYAAQPLYKDGFCIPAHKMAHTRAYQKYVTQKAGISPGPADQRVTRKTHASSRTTQGKKRKKRK